MNNNYVDQAKGLLSEIGVHQLSEGVWAFSDVHTANHAYIHHSREPVALAAYAAVNTTFAAGRFPGWALTYASQCIRAPKYFLDKQCGES